MADGQLAGQLSQHGRREDLRHVAHVLDAVDLPSVARRDAGALLAAMLQREQAQVAQLGRFRISVDRKNTALVVEFIEHSSPAPFPSRL